MCIRDRYPDWKQRVGTHQEGVMIEDRWMVWKIGTGHWGVRGHNRTEPSWRLEKENWETANETKNKKRKKKRKRNRTRRERTKLNLKEKKTFEIYWKNFAYSYRTWEKRMFLAYVSVGFNIQSWNIRRKIFIDMYSKYESFEYKNFWATSFYVFIHMSSKLSVSEASPG